MIDKPQNLKSFNPASKGYKKIVLSKVKTYYLRGDLVEIDAPNEKTGFPGQYAELAASSLVGREIKPEHGIVWRKY